MSEQTVCAGAPLRFGVAAVLEEKIARLVATLEEQFAEGARLEKAIRRNLEVLGIPGGDGR